MLNRTLLGIDALDLENLPLDHPKRPLWGFYTAKVQHILSAAPAPETYPRSIFRGKKGYRMDKSTFIILNINHNVDVGVHNNKFNSNIEFILISSFNCLY